MTAGYSTTRKFAAQPVAQPVELTQDEQKAMGRALFASAKRLDAQPVAQPVDDLVEGLRNVHALQELCHEAAARIVALKADVARITDDRNAKSKRMWELGQEAERAESDLAAAQADAERYRWIRDCAYGFYGHISLLPPDEMDDAIDAAVKETAALIAARKVKP